MKRTRLAPRGARTIAESDAYDDAKADLEAAARGRCVVGPLIATVDSQHRCRRRYDAPHHLRKTGQGGSKINPANMLACCNPCNGWIEDHPKLARMLGLVVRDGDPRWVELGRRSDKAPAAT